MDTCLDCYVILSKNIYKRCTNCANKYKGRNKPRCLICNKLISHGCKLCRDCYLCKYDPTRCIICNIKIDSRAKYCWDCHSDRLRNNPKLNSNYKHGNALLEYPYEFHKIKYFIIERDNFECQNCGITQNKHNKKFGYKLDIHHIDYNKFNNLDSNLITLCRNCNLKANTTRDYWYAYYTYKMEDK